MKKVLIYHYTQDNHPQRRGGGIGYYQRNIVPILSRIPEIRLSVLSSGSWDLYDFWDSSIRIKQQDSGEASKVSRYALMNSPMSAPAGTKRGFGNPASLSHPEAVKVFCDFVRTHGFDVIHFNHFEGIPAEVLSIKKELPGIKIIFSVHDYYAFCPSVVFLYKGKELCEDSEGGKKCESCYPVNPVNFEMWKNQANRLVNQFELNPKGNFALLVTKFFRIMNAFRHPLISKKSEVVNFAPEWTFRNWKKIVALLNAHADVILPVSDRVKEISIRSGVNPSLLQTLRIGTPDAIKFRNIPFPEGKILGKDGFLTMAYIGSMGYLKGFSFLLDAIDMMPETMARRINLVVAARNPEEPSLLDRMSKLQLKLKSLTHLDGYVQTQLDEILSSCQMGILCHVWEETGPIIGWEFHSRKIPILTSDLGGAPEISGCRKMVFKHGDIPSFLEKIDMILSGGITHEEYWKNSTVPETLEEHCDKLLKLYLS